MQLQAQIHQPSMKVFTVGLDDKGVKMDQPEKQDIEKATPIMAPAPIIYAAPPPMKKSRSFKGVTYCVFAFFFALVVALIISEIAYHRQRDQEFFRLKWAEMKQRMMGYDLWRTSIEQQRLLQQQQNQAQQAPQSGSFSLLSQQEAADRPPVVDERLAWAGRLRGGKTDDHDDAIPTMAPPTATSSSEGDDNVNPLDVRFAFLKAILEKIRERAQEAGMDGGKMHVSVIEVRRPTLELSPRDENNNSNEQRNLSPDSDSFQDGFGEVAAPHPLTGMFHLNQREQQPFEVFQPREERPAASDFFGPHWEHPSQFLPQMRRPFDAWQSSSRDADNTHENVDAPFWPRPWDAHGNNNNNRMEENSDEDKPQMRITHHFSQENPAGPSRVVTELFGDASEKMMANLMQQQQQHQQPSPSVDSTGSSFPRWEANNDERRGPMESQEGPLFPMMGPRGFMSSPREQLMPPMFFPQGFPAMGMGAFPRDQSVVPFSLIPNVVPQAEQPPPFPHMLPRPFPAAGQPQALPQGPNGLPIFPHPLIQGPFPQAAQQVGAVPRPLPWTPFVDHRQVQDMHELHKEEPRPHDLLAADKAAAPIVPAEPHKEPFVSAQNDDDDSSAASFGSAVGQRMGEQLGEHLREQQRLPFGVGELPNNEVIDVKPLNNENGVQALQTLPWYVPKGFEHERPAWASQGSNEGVVDRESVPLIFPHPAAREEPIIITKPDSGELPPATNGPVKSDEASKSSQTSNDDDVEEQKTFAVHSGEVRGPAWMRAQPLAAEMPAEPVDAPVLPPRPLLPERDADDQSVAKAAADNEESDSQGPMVAAQHDDDSSDDTKRVLFQVDEPRV